jgi:hypothetical protein
MQISRSSRIQSMCRGRQWLAGLAALIGGLQAAPVLVIAAALVVILSTHGDYAVTWDEPVQARLGEEVLDSLVSARTLQASEDL